MFFLNKMKMLFKKAREKSPSGLLLMHISQQLEDMSENMHEQVEAAVSGHHGLPASSFEYVLQDRSGEELQTEWQDNDYITCDDISNTDGYRALLQNAETSGLSLKLTEEQVEEVDDEDRVRFIVCLSGWAK